MTPEQFIESAPLYTRFNAKDFSHPQSITRMCHSKSCKRETTWFSTRDYQKVDVPSAPEITFRVIGYTCALCRQNSLAVIYEMLDWREDQKSNRIPKLYHHFGVRKIGQIPAEEIAIPAELETRLGSSAIHYKKALICRSQNYGIGAMAYLRRVVDEKTDELIDVMAELAQTYSVEEKEIKRLLATKSEVRYEDKLRLAAELIPQALRPGGINPLGQLYQQISIGLHGKSDDECIAIFDDLKTDFEYVFRNLHLQAEERREFAHRVQARAGKSVKA